MSRYVPHALSSRKVRAIVLTLLAVSAGWAVAYAARGWAERNRQRSVPALESSLSQPSRWLSYSGVVLEVDLDEVTTEADSYRGIVFDREALVVLVEDVVGLRDGVEDMPLTQLLQEIPRVRLVKDGRSIVLGRYTLRRLIGRALGDPGAFRTGTLGDLLDVLSGVEVTAADIPEKFDARSFSVILREAFQRQAPLDHSRDPGFRDRQERRRRYLEVQKIVKDVRRAGYGNDGDEGVVYDEAYTVLIGAGRTEDIELLDAHMRFEEELAAADMKALTFAERIAFRWEARRWAFGEELAEELFRHKEAMERYMIDRLNIEGDDYAEPAAKSRWLRDRRNALKVELAAQGTYVGFPDDGDSSLSAASPVQQDAADGSASATDGSDSSATESEPAATERPTRRQRRRQ